MNIYIYIYIYNTSPNYQQKPSKIRKMKNNTHQNY